MLNGGIADFPTLSAAEPQPSGSAEDYSWLGAAEDLAEFDFSGMDFTGIDFAGVDFAGVDGDVDMSGMNGDL